MRESRTSTEHERPLLGSDDVRLGPGPVFIYEWLTTTRRWQLYAMRLAFVGSILVGMLLVWHNARPTRGPGQTASMQTLATYGESLFKTIVSIELTLVLLAAPAATAGSICLDKARGTLDHMLATDLSNAEIVLGKLAVRLVPVLSLIACVLPVMALASLLGGIDPTALFGSFTIAIACAVLGCSLALTLSVWGRKTHEVLMLTYLILVLWLMNPMLVDMIAELLGVTPRPSYGSKYLNWIGWTNPYFLAFAPYSDPGNAGVWTYLAFLGSCLSAAALLAVLATRRVRGVALRQAGRPTAAAPPGKVHRHFPALSWWPTFSGPSLDGNPILWREWHRSRPSGILRVVWILYTALGLLWIAILLKGMISMQPNYEMIALLTAFQVSLGLLLLSVNAATSLAEERVRGSLDVLLCTPLPTQAILAGKWWGTYRKAIPVMIWPAILAGFGLVESGNLVGYGLLLGLIAAYCAAITSLGLAMATWISRLGRALAVSVSAYVVFSIGWAVVAIVLASGANATDRFIVPLIMASPFYGSAFATMSVSPGDMHLGGVSAATVSLGALFWTLVIDGVALGLFWINVATFDHCMGRASEDSSAISESRKRSTKRMDPELEDWLAENPAEVMLRG